MSKTSMINIGMDSPYGKVNPELALFALERAGGKVLDYAIHVSATELTFVAELDDELGYWQAYVLAASLGQDAVAQWDDNKGGSIVGPRADKWEPFIPDYFLKLDGERLSK